MAVRLRTRKAGKYQNTGKPKYRYMGGLRATKNFNYGERVDEFDVEKEYTDAATATGGGHHAIVKNKNRYYRVRKPHRSSYTIGKTAGFANHSNKPNCRIAAHRDGKAYIKAGATTKIRKGLAIKKGEDITVDYGNPTWTSTFDEAARVEASRKRRPYLKQGTRAPMRKPAHPIGDVT